MRSKKEIADESIQGTNDSSIASKRSVERLYSKPGDVEFFKHFVPKPQRRSPVINRGYWTRMHAMSFNIDRFADTPSDKKKVVINLGCGFDPYAFQCLAKRRDLVFVDVDYPDLMQKKADTIMNNSELREILGNIQSVDGGGSIENGKTSSATGASSISSSSTKNSQTGSRSKPKKPSHDVHLRSDNYYAISCDLRDLKTFSSILDSLFALSETSFLFTAEVSLTYMIQKCADDLIQWAASLPDAHFSLLEQMMPGGEAHPFAKRMLNHFKSYGSPLNCIEAYPRLADQVRRFESRGWSVNSAKDLYRFWKEDVTKEQKQFVESVEQFDEWEEFILFGQHYFILHAVNSGDKLSLENEDSRHQNSNLRASVRIEDPVSRGENNKQLEVKLAAGSEFHDKLVSHGGMYMSRRNELVDVYSNDTISAASETRPRVCHTITELTTGELMLVGGREGPIKLLSDCWIYSSDSNSWKRVDDLPQPRYRHCAAALPDGKLLVYGGSSSGDSPFLIWSRSSGWIEVDAGGMLECRFSAALAWCGSCGVIVGGMRDRDVCRDAYRVEFNGSSNTVSVCKIQSADALLERYSAQAIFKTDSTVLICGGVSEHELFGHSSALVELNTVSGEVKPYIVDTQPLWCSFSMKRDPVTRAITTFGGGAACYGFGSHWDGVGTIREE